MQDPYYQYSAVPSYSGEDSLDPSLFPPAHTGTRQESAAGILSNLSTQPFYTHAGPSTSNGTGLDGTIDGGALGFDAPDDEDEDEVVEEDDDEYDPSPSSARKKSARAGKATANGSTRKRKSRYQEAEESGGGEDDSGSYASGSVAVHGDVGIPTGLDGYGEEGMEAYQQAEAAATDEHEPLYVNAKQFHRILKRRLARARLEEMGRLSRQRKAILEAGGTIEGVDWPRPQ
ncbi:nuclear transcription factor Y, alpha [Pseudohyphozyma bogoriensis]|nr:nuclear transcription factor Y, alpha [Pseudohyphozyma bogoriensis]